LKGVTAKEETMAVAHTEAQQAFAARMLEKHITPLWTVSRNLVKTEPTPMIPPVYWSYQHDVRPYILEAADVITAAEAHRRVLVLNNPTLKHGATHTLTCAIQLIKGGEVAPAHRHSQAALRFIIEGEGAYTAVNGERTYMKPGDFVVTPAWTWHDHGKENDGVMIWLDGLDVPLVNHLGATFSDDYDEDKFPQSRPPHDSFSRYGSGMLPLTPVAGRNSPVFSYPYTRTREALENLRKADDWDVCHGLKLKFANPATGDWVMPTIATFAQLLPKGFHTSPYRSTEATVVMVAEGSGKAVVGDQTYTLQKNDIFVAPNWTWWEMEAKDDLVLLSYSDRAVLEKLDLWREQRANEPLHL
jgi:gentisate 1,2-dioxygenase